MRATVLTAVVGMAATAVATPAGAVPAEESAASIRARVTRLYVQAERATERYNATAERVKRLTGRLHRTQQRLARGQAEVNRLRDALGALAGARYRAGGVDPAVLLLLSDSPDDYLARAAALQRISNIRRGQLYHLQRALRTVRQHRSEAAATLAELERRRAALGRHKRSIERKLATARSLLSQLTAAEAGRGRASRAGEDGRGLLWGVTSDRRAAAAVAAAVRALGAPYGWGQAGPRAFDCSGLTQWAYAQAGVALPRTSQAQSRIGRRVSLAQARPGDLVIYRQDASHVAMYVGRGRVIHAPHPGARVRHDPVHMMPISAVVRP